MADQKLSALSAITTAAQSDLLYIVGASPGRKITVANLFASAGVIIQTSASATAFSSGPNGATNPVFQLVNSTSSQADGVSITGLAAGSGVTLTALSSGANAPITLTPKGTGSIAVPVGSATNPSIVASGATQTGLFFFSGVNPSISVAGTQIIEWFAGGEYFRNDNTIDIGATGAGRPKNLYLGTGLAVEATVTAGGTTGNQTINKAAGTVNIAGAGTTVTVTNNLCTTSSLVFAVARTNDSAATVKNVVANAGNFVITLTAAANAEISIGFFIVQPD